MVPVRLAVMVGSDVRDADGVLVSENVQLTDGVGVCVRVVDAVAVLEPVLDAVWLAVTVLVGVPLPVALTVAL